MKKTFVPILYLLLAILLVACSGKEYDDSAIRQSISSLEGRIAQLEQRCAELNTNLSALGAVVSALQQNDYVKSVTPIMKDHEIIGYTFEFAKGGATTIYLQSESGENAPEIGVKKDADGRWYWVVNGEWVLDPDGNKVPATARTPQLRYEEGYWYVSYDEGKTWEQFGSGEAAACQAIFKKVNVSETGVEFFLMDGTSFTIPVYTSPTLLFDVEPVSLYYAQKSFAIRFTVIGAPEDTEIDCMASGDWKAEIRAYRDGEGDVLITPGTQNDGKVLVWITFNGFSQVKALCFEKGVVSVQGGVKFDSYGGTETVPIHTNCEYTYSVEYLEGEGWLTVAETKAAFRDESLSVTAQPNEGDSRSAKIVFKSLDGDTISEVVVVQSTAYPLDGKWYLGLYRWGANVISFDGKETLEFHGLDMSWTHTNDGDSYFSIQYNADMNGFMATDLATGSVLNVGIEEKTARRIVLSFGGDVYRYFYSDQEEARTVTASDIDISDLTPDPPGRTPLTDINEILKYSYGDTHSDATPMGIHYVNAHVTTDSDRSWLADATQEPGVIDNMMWKEATITLYPFGEPSPADCNQHAIGDCSLISVLASMAYIYPDYIKHIIKDHGDKTYSVSLFDPQGKAVDVRVSSKVMYESDGSTIGQVTGKYYTPNWATILEKALIKWEDIYHVDNIWGIGSEFAAAILTGDGDSFAFSPNSLHASEMSIVVDWCLKNGKITIGGFNVANLKCDQLYTVVAHAFAFMYTTKSDYLFSMRNPWGHEGALDGVLNIPDDRLIISSIDMRIISPGAAAPYRKSEIGPYYPPAF